MINSPVEYPDEMKVSDALPSYFSKYHFENGGYHLMWFKIKVGPLYIPFPNTKGRIAAVKIHDIHHLLTEYKANLRGEAEIAGWEIASGCGKYFAAWFLNFGSFFYGMFFFMAPMLRAFLNGRKCVTNFYHGVEYNDALLNKTLGELRMQTGMQSNSKNNMSDYLLFFIYCLLLLSMVVALILLAEKIIRFLF